MRMTAVLGFGLFALSLGHVSSSLGQFAGASDKFTPVVMRASVEPIAFAGSDGFTHLDYELQIINPRAADIAIDSIEVLDAGTGAVLLKLSGSELTRWVWHIDREPVAKLGRSQAGYAWLDVKVKGAAPQRLRHRVTLVRDGSDMRAVSVAEGGEVAVSRQTAIVIGPPLEGRNWLATSACCTSFTHRRAGMPINGTFFVAQRFAIDWLKVGDDGRIVHGNWTVNTDYPTYGQRAIAVADATVVSVLDGLPERKAGALPPDTTLQNATGNHVILDLGGGRYGFYAHLQPASIRVKVGERVKRGQPLALLGNSGNTSGPHLHFHVVDGMSPLGAQGVPYVITGFTLVGQAGALPDDDEEKYMTTPLKLQPLPPPSARQLQYPMDYVVVDFPDAKLTP